MIPSSSILLDDDGGLFVRTINNRDLVESFSVKVLGETTGGTWVSGLPRISNVITVGQNYVVDKEQVNPIFLVSQDDI
jgi:multidrug efflux system membrane fusion protein